MDNKIQFIYINFKIKYEVMQNVSGYGEFLVGNTTCLIFAKVFKKRYQFRKN